VSEVFHSDGVRTGADEPYLFAGAGQRPDPKHASYSSSASFSDPDGNGLLFQEITTRCRDASRLRRPSLGERSRRRDAACRGSSCEHESGPASAMANGGLVR